MKFFTMQKEIIQIVAVLVAVSVVPALLMAGCASDRKQTEQKMYLQAQCWWTVTIL